MQFEIDTRELKEAVALATRTTIAKPPLPALAGLWIEVTPGEVILAGTDSASFCRVVLPVMGADPGVALPNARKLGEVLSALNAATLHVELDEAKKLLVLRAGTGRSKTTTSLTLMEPDEFPRLPDVPNLPSNVDGAALAFMLQRVLFAVGNDDNRAYLSGVHAVLNHQITLDAADGFRLSHGTVAWLDQYTTDLAEGIIPAVAAETMLRVLRREEDAWFNIDLQARKAFLRSGNVTVGGALIDTKFPDLSAVFPKDHSQFVHVSQADLARALKVVHVVAKDSNDTVKLTVEAGADHMVIEASANELGDSKIIVPVDQQSGGSITIAVNGTYLRDAVEACPTTLVRLETTVPQKPIAVYPVGESNWVHVCMPMHLPK